MRAVVSGGPRQVGIEGVCDAQLEQPVDVLVPITWADAGAPTPRGAQRDGDRHAPRSSSGRGRDA